MHYQIDWSAPVGHTPLVLQMVPGLTAANLSGRRTNGHGAKLPGKGPAKRWAADEIVESAFCVSLQRLGFTTSEAFSCWEAAGLPFLSLHSALEPEARVDTVALAVWRRPDRSIAVALMEVPEANLPAAIVPELAEAQAAGLPIITMEISALVRAIERAIRHFAPDCEAVARRIAA